MLDSSNFKNIEENFCKCNGYLQIDQCCRCFLISHQCPIDLFSDITTTCFNRIAHTYSKNYFDINHLVSITNLSKPTINKYFKMDFSCNPSQIINFLRMYSSLNLICLEKYNLKEVANLTGYTTFSIDYNYKKLLNLTPSEVRDKLIVLEQPSILIRELIKVMIKKIINGKSDNFTYSLLNE